MNLRPFIKGIWVLFLLIGCNVTATLAEEIPLYQQILNHLKSDPDVVLPWRPDSLDVDTMFNREAPVPPQCYTNSNGIHNPCYVCHQDNLSGRENTMNDHDLQEAYSFSDTGLTNHWKNLFEDRSERVGQISDAEILEYINRDNYSELPQRLRKAGFTGWIPDLTDLQLGAAAFDEDGFAKDNSGWVAFNYKPLPSTFWPTQGSTDDVMIRLPQAFYKTKSGTISREIYKANLALLEANIKGYTSISSWPIDENVLGVDLDGDNKKTLASRVSANRSHYLGAASQIERIPHVYPIGTEFLHTVRYVGVAADGSIYNPPHMKEVRYMKRRLQSRHFQLLHYYEEENLEKEMGSLPSYKNFDEGGLSSNFGWNVTGFIENKQGRLRWNTYEENVFCMGCHSSIGSTIDKTFSFVRKVDGVGGWGYINLQKMKDAPNVGEFLGETATYLKRVGGGTEFRSNPELEERFYYADGSVNTISLASAVNMYELITPSPQRALQLNKAYKTIVEEQDFIFGRDATVTPPKRVLADIDNETSPTLTDDHQYDWNMLLDWSSVAGDSCNYSGDVDFGQLNGAAYEVFLRGVESNDVNHICASGLVTLTGPLQIILANNFVPELGYRVELIRAGNLLGAYSKLLTSNLDSAVFRLEQTATALTLAVVKDSDYDGIADIDDNCAVAANGPVLLDVGGNSQRDTDGDGFGNLCDTDLNDDGVTNQLDSIIFRDRVGTNDQHADFNGDGVVNQLDANILRTQFGKMPGPARAEI